MSIITKDLFNATDYGLKSQYYSEPIYDLLSKVSYTNPKNILDIGCGSGNSSKAILAKWSEANILGIDSSQSMVAEAIRTNSTEKIKFSYDSIEGFVFKNKFDIILSFATLQFVFNHNLLLPNLLDKLTTKGILAIQMPNNFDSPLHRAINETALEKPFNEHLVNFNPFNWQDANYYFSILSQIKNVKYKIWEITYFRNDSLDGLIEWSMTTSMLPYLKKVPATLQSDFVTKVRNIITSQYPVITSNQIVYKQKRIFILIEKVPNY